MKPGNTVDTNLAEMIEETEMRSTRSIKLHVIKNQNK